MSKAKPKPRVKKEEAPDKTVSRVEKPATREIRPSGRPPQAEVLSRHGDGMLTRRGKGFSIGEMGRASFPIRLAGPWDIPIDLRRRSVLDANVQTLLKWRPTPIEPVKPMRVETAPSTAAARKKPVKKRTSSKKKRVKRKSSAR
ncbi:MAG: hypothetical protein OK404_03300 [Thaumarchaeota archaeon]|nr:hypothetical protein [Nitrososphaerota archaeon]